MCGTYKKASFYHYVMEHITGKESIKLEIKKQKRNRENSNPKEINLKVRINKDMYIKLLKYSQNQGITASEAVRQAIKNTLGE